MTLIQIIEAAVAAAGVWLAEHPIRAALTVVGVLLGSTITVKRLELPIYRWARDWINARLDGLGKRLTASLMTEIEKQGGKIAALESAVKDLKEAQAKAEATADRRRADDHRQEILRFNLALMEGSHPDRESYVEILRRIDRYEGYCREHPEYPNSRSEAAIRNIIKHYDNRQKVGFNQEV